MKWRSFLLTICIIFSVIPPAIHASDVAVLSVEGVIDPFVARYIDKKIKKAGKNNVDLIIIQLDTPGGLVDSTLEIIKSMLNTSIPVVVYISPRGARAASAGTYITMASDIAAMAPSTHIGAAHPVTLAPTPQKWDKKDALKKLLEHNVKDDTAEPEKTPLPKPTGDAMLEKITNFLVSKMKTLAKRRGRNIEWAEDSVRKSVMIDDEEALGKNVIEIRASDINDLLEQLNGKSIVKNGDTYVLNTSGANTLDWKMSTPNRFMHAIAHPQIAMILFLAGVLGIFFEFKTPGLGFPGVIGGISLILAFLSLQVLPINIAGLLLMLLGVVLLILEIKIISHGILTIGGLTSFVIGAMILVDAAPEAGYYRISMTLLITSIIIVVGLAAGVVYLVKKDFSRKAVTGEEGIIGEEGVTKTELSPEGMVMVHGELWNAILQESEHLPENSKVVVTSFKDNRIFVKPSDKV